jgi:hypothetical protein
MLLLLKQAINFFEGTGLQGVLRTILLKAQWRRKEQWPEDKGKSLTCPTEALFSLRAYCECAAGRPQL